MLTPEMVSPLVDINKRQELTGKVEELAANELLAAPHLVHYLQQLHLQLVVDLVKLDWSSAGSETMRNEYANAAGKLQAVESLLELPRLARRNNLTEGN